MPSFVLRVSRAPFALYGGWGNTRSVSASSRGDALLAPGVTRRLIAEFARRPEPARVAPDSLSALTEREREVLVLIARGMTNDEIADALVVSPATAKTHVSRVMG